MRFRSAAAAGALLASLACTGVDTRPAEQPSEASRDSDRDLPSAEPGALYAIGVALGGPVKPYALDADEAAEISRGVADAALGRASVDLGDEQLSAQVLSFHERRLKALAQIEEDAGAATLERAAQVDGAIRTDTGMVLHVLDAGSGPSPGIFDFVRVNYHGTLRDGTVFYSNRGAEPEQMRLGVTMRCWQQALGAVAAGARVRAVCPPSLGYGWTGWNGRVPGGAVLTFDLELLEVIPGEEP